MKFKKQRNLFTINKNIDSVANLITNSPNKQENKHGPLLPNSIRCIICGPSNCGKTNVMFSLLTNPNTLRFENVYIFSKSLQQPKYILLSRIMDGIPEIGYFAFDNEENVPSPEDAKKNSIIIFDDVACDNQDRMRKYFCMGRHKDVDCFYLTQSYTRIPKHLLRDNANMLILFKQDDLNLKHIYDEHVNMDMSLSQFKDLCTKCWNKDRYGFVVICKDFDLTNGRYRCGLDTYVMDI
jgi:hypothetical protein